MRRYNYIFDGTLKAGHDFTYKYDPKDPFRLLSVDAKEYRSSTEEVDTTRREHSYAFDGNGNLVLQLSDLAERIDSASFADTAAMQVRQYLWDEDNHLLAINDNGFVSNYFYDAAGERTVKISAPDLAVFVNGTEALKNDSALVKFVGYVSPYLVVSNGGRYTKHIYAGTQRIASKVGDIEAFGADPRREEYAGANLKEVDFGSKYEQQTKVLLARYDSLGVMNKPRELNDYVGGQSFCCGEKELVSNNQTGDNTFETPDYEHLIFFYHPDHLGSTALVTDNDGNVVQSVAYIPYGEVFIEERNGTWNTPYLFNGKELDEETGLYYYGARYLNPTSGMWLSVDPLFEKYVGMSPYNYCAGNPVMMVDPDGRKISTNDVETCNAILDDIFANYSSVRKLFSFDSKGSLKYNKSGRSPAERDAKVYINSLNVSSEQKQDMMSALICLIDMFDKTIDNDRNISVTFESQSETGGGVFNCEPEFDIDNPQGGNAVLDPNGTFPVHMVKVGTTDIFEGNSTLGERFVHEVLGHGGSYINQWNGFADRNAIQASNLYHRIRGDGLLRTGLKRNGDADHDNIQLKNPAFRHDPYNWLKAIDQNPNINIHIYSNEGATYSSFKRRGM